MKTIEDYRTMLEGQTFDRKSAKIESKALAVTMVAMANADGGTIAVGFEDDGTISGIDGMTEHINDLLRVPFDYCIPSVNVHPERMACFDKDVNETAITEIARQHPYYFVLHDSSLATDNVADNFEQIWEEYSKETIRRIL